MSNKEFDYLKIFEDINSKASEIFTLVDNLELEVSFVNIEEMKQINFEQRKIDKVTDVLSFPYLDLQQGLLNINEHKYDINPETNNLMLGEIVICKDIAIRQAEEFGHSFQREMSYLYLHGLLHLLGFDHVDDGDKVLMRKFEEEILKSLNIVREEK